MSAGIHWHQLLSHEPLPGISGSVHSGKELSAALFRLDPGAAVPRHQHVNEEFGQILAGSLELEVGSSTTLLRAGEGFLIPGDVPHAALAGEEGCLLLECYAPPRNPFVPQESGTSS